MPQKYVRNTYNKKSKKIDPESTVGGAVCLPINLEVSLGIEGMTDLMQAAYDLNVDSVEIAILYHPDLTVKDSKGKSATDYLFAGYNEKMRPFWARQPRGEKIDLSRMSQSQQKDYKLIQKNLATILTLFGANQLS